MPMSTLSGLEIPATIISISVPSGESSRIRSLVRLAKIRYPKLCSLSV